ILKTKAQVRICRKKALLKLKREENPNKKGPKFKEMVFTLQIAGNVDFNYQGNMEELVQQNVHK
ncbi:hypothetical protein H0E87_021469, partial [Populus deltoides]